MSFMVLKMAKEMGFDDIAGTMGSAVRMVSQVIKAIGNEDETDPRDYAGSKKHRQCFETA